jgi:arylformamidase
MRREDYPPQEPLSEVGERYSAECWRRSGDIVGEEHGYGPDPYQRVLVFPAAKPDGRVLIFWHGGGWTSGYKEWMGFMAPAFTAAGVTFVSAGYRLAPQHVFPAGLDDCMAAVAWVHGNVKKYGAQPDRLYIGGHSAGGHYAALLAVRRDWQEAHGLPAGAIKGCLPISGVYLFTEGSGLSARPRFLGGAGNERPASPIHCLQPPLPPFLVAYGTDDFPHLIKQAESFCAAIIRAGARVERLEMPGRNHFSASYAGGEPDGPWVGAALQFMR